ncbi:MAG: hypothetical protein ACJ77B_03060 [Chloroflexota bacterium]
MTERDMQAATAMNEQLARRLEAFALERLSPDAAATERMRSAVMAAATARAAGTAACAADAAEPAWEPPIPIFSRRLTRPRRLLVGLMAATLALSGVAGAALAASPGGPLYDARLWVERATLPTEPDARADAEVARLEARMGEAVRGANSGNGSAVSAALAAYRATIDEALEASDATESGGDRLEAALARHLIVLQTLLDRVPYQARDAIQRAIDNGDKAVERIDKAKGPKPNAEPTPKPNGGNGGNAGGGGNGNGGNGNGPKSHPGHGGGRGSDGKPGG